MFLIHEILFFATIIFLITKPTIKFFYFWGKLIEMNIVVTGASRGIGFALAMKFAQSTENKVFAFARSEAKLAGLKEKIESFDQHAQFFYTTFDLLRGDIKNDLLPAIHKDLGSIDILINNAGLLVNKPFEELTDADFDLTFDVNVKGVFKLIRDLLPLFNKQAHIVNISSMGGFQGSAKFPGFSLYSASKGAVSVLTECLAEELKDRNISVNALAIGAVQTEMLAEAFPGFQAPVTAEEMAAFIADFAVNGPKYFNGKVIPVSSSTP